MYPFGSILSYAGGRRYSKDVDKTLETELRTYEQHRKQLLGTSEGKFVLIRNDEIVGVHDSKMDAIAQGYQKFGNVPFLVKQIVTVEAPQNFISNLLGV